MVEMKADNFAPDDLDSHFESNSMPFAIWRQKHKDLWLAASLYAFATFVFCICSPRSLWTAHTTYNHFAWLAEALVHGRLSLAGPPPIYAGGNDFARFENHWFVVFPPFPALLLIPLAALTRHVDDIRDGAFFLMIAGLAPVGILVALQRLRHSGASAISEKTALSLSVLFAFGTVYFFTSVQGTVWYAAHVVATVAMTFFIAGAIEARHPIWAGLALSAVVATRTHLGLVGVFFLLEALRVGRASVRSERGMGWPQVARRLLLFLLPCTITVVGLLIYNWARFHDPFEVGYRYLQIAWQPRIAKWGMFSYHFLGRNLGIVLASLPYVNTGEHFPRFQINAHGLALWITSPFYIWLLWPKLRSPIHGACYVALVVAAIPSLLYQNSGWIQFGQRFSNDYSPWLFILFAIGFDRFGRFFKVAAALAVAVNLFGALTFQRDGWNAYYFIEGTQKVIYQPD